MISETEIKRYVAPKHSETVVVTDETVEQYENGVWKVIGTKDDIVEEMAYLFDINFRQ